MVPSAPGWVMTTRARCSMFTWCTIPVPGGTTLNWLNASWPQRRKPNRSRLRWNSNSTLRSNASGRPNTSAITEWSMTSSAGTSGLIRPGSPPRSRIASRMVARSTTAGTPVRSCMITRAGLNWISVSGSACGSQDASAVTWSARDVHAVLGPQQVLQQDLQAEREVRRRPAPRPAGVSGSWSRRPAACRGCRSCSLSSCGLLPSARSARPATRYPVSAAARMSRRSGIFPQPPARPPGRPGFRAAPAGRARHAAR